MLLLTSFHAQKHEHQGQYLVTQVTLHDLQQLLCRQCNLGIGLLSFALSSQESTLFDNETLQRKLRGGPLQELDFHTVAGAQPQNQHWLLLPDSVNSVHCLYQLSGGYILVITIHNGIHPVTAAPQRCICPARQCNGWRDAVGKYLHVLMRVPIAVIDDQHGVSCQGSSRGPLFEHIPDPQPVFSPHCPSDHSSATYRIRRSHLEGLYYCVEKITLCTDKQHVAV